jgi:hypothetical protein
VGAEAGSGLSQIHRPISEGVKGGLFHGAIRKFNALLVQTHKDNLEKFNLAKLHQVLIPSVESNIRAVFLGNYTCLNALNNSESAFTSRHHNGTTCT